MSSTLKIKNFGPISEVNIENSKLSIFMGSNNSGKSFTARLLHMLLNPLDNNMGHFSSNIKNLKLNSVELYDINNTIYKNIITNLNNYLKPITTTEDIYFKISKKEFKLLINNELSIIYSYIIQKRLKELFNVNNLDELIHSGEDFFEIKFNNLHIYKKAGEKLLVENLYNLFKTKKSVFSVNENNFKIKETDTYFCIYPTKELFKNTDNLNMKDMSAVFYSIFINNLLNSFICGYSFYISNKRQESFKKFNETIFKNLKNKHIDFTIQKELDSNIFNDEFIKKGIFYDIASKIEEEMLLGEIKFKKINDSIEIYYYDRKHNLTLPLNSLSSYLNELIPFVFYLKYVLEKGDTLVIEEPEAHLHPSNQRKIVKYIVECVNNDLNIVIITHSDYIIDQLNNHIRLANMPSNKFQNEFNYITEDILNFKDVKIYTFESQNSFDFINKEVEIYPTGFDEDNFTPVSSSLYNESIKIIDAKRK